MSVRSVVPVVAALLAAGSWSSARGGLIVAFDDGSGLSAEAEFQLLGAGDALRIRLQNTSTSIPAGFDSADQLLTGLSWDSGGAMITGGSAAVGPTSQSLNFDVFAGPGDDVSGEWGFGNAAVSGALTNFITGNSAGATAFGGANLDGPAGLDGPQAGLISSLDSVPLGGLGAIQDELIVLLTLSDAFSDELEIFGSLGKVRIEFGSDERFITVNVPGPGPGAPLLAVATAHLLRRRRSLNAGGVGR